MKNTLLKKIFSIGLLFASFCGFAQAQPPFYNRTVPPQNPQTNSLMNPGNVWGSPWGAPWNAPTVINPPGAAPNWQNQGIIPVMACGYDMQGVWRTIPMKVKYVYNGVQYDVTVLNVWNPWTDMWDRGVDDPAFNTSYVLRGTTFNFYTVTTTGTYYFNL